MKEISLTERDYCESLKTVTVRNMINLVNQFIHSQDVHNSFRKYVLTSMIIDHLRLGVTPVHAYAHVTDYLKATYHNNI